MTVVWCHGATQAERPPLGPFVATRGSERRADRDEQVELAAARFTMFRLSPRHSPTITVVGLDIVAPSPIPMPSMRGSEEVVNTATTPTIVFTSPRDGRGSGVRSSPAR
jgi:hypothetical protein